MGVEKGGFRAFRLHTCANFRTFVLAIEMRVHCGLRLSIARASSALHSPCTAVALSIREVMRSLEENKKLN